MTWSACFLWWRSGRCACFTRPLSSTNRTKRDWACQRDATPSTHRRPEPTEYTDSRQGSTGADDAGAYGRYYIRCHIPLPFHHESHETERLVRHNPDLEAPLIPQRRGARKVPGSSRTFQYSRSGISIKVAGQSSETTRPGVSLAV